MEMAVKSMETAVAAMESIWLRGHFTVPIGCQNRDFYHPKFVGGGGGAAELFLEKHRLI
jgi:hypothetical protein